MLFYRRTKDWMNFYTFSKIEEKEVSVLVPKLLHFIYVGKPIRENYIDNIRNCTRSDDDNDRNCNFSPQDKHCKLQTACRFNINEEDANEFHYDGTINI